jgi:hypothetical protein
MDLYLKNSTSMPVKLIMLAMILLTGLSSLAQDFQDAAAYRCVWGGHKHRLAQ